MFFMHNHDQLDQNLVRKEKDLSSSEEFVMNCYKEKYLKAQDKPETPEQEKEVQRLKEKFPPQTERSVIFDRIVHHFKKWWGDSVEVYRATRIDDYTNATDLIVEFIDANNNRVAVLSLDTTVVNDNLDTILSKSQKIIDKLREGKMGELKYMPSFSNKKPFEEKDLIPQAIVALNLDTLERLCGDIKQSVGEDDKEQKMKFSSYQLVMLDSVVEQLVTQREILNIYEQKGRITIEQKKEMDAKLVQIIEILKTIILQKENPPEGLGVKADATWEDHVSAFFKNHGDFLRLAA